MSTSLNRETGDATKPFEKVISVQIGSEQHAFSLWCTRYAGEKLTREDWLDAGKRLQEHVATTRRGLALTGQLFCPEAGAYLRKSVEAAMKQIVYEVFRARQVALGNLEWQVDPLLSGLEYQV